MVEVVFGKVSLGQGPAVARATACAAILGALALGLSACKSVQGPSAQAPQANRTAPPKSEPEPTSNLEQMSGEQVFDVRAELEQAGRQILAALTPRDFADRVPIRRFVRESPGPGELRLRIDTADAAAAHGTTTDASAALPPGALCRYDNGGLIACSAGQLQRVLAGAIPAQRRTFLSFVIAHELGHYVAKRAAVVPSFSPSASLREIARQLNTRLPEAIDLERRADAFATSVLLRLVEQWAPESGSVEAARALAAGHLRLLKSFDALGSDARRESVPLPASPEYAR